MAQKINPLGFRLGKTQNHYSLWFAQPKNYSEGLQEDQRIRDCIKNYIQKNRKTSSASTSDVIVRIEIQKSINVTKVILYLGHPKLLIEDRPEALKDLKINVQKELNCVNRKLNLVIRKIAEPYRHPTILAEFLAEQFKNRVPFRKTMKKAIELAEEAGAKGIQIKVAGRLDGKDLARVEWVREGRVPLQTIRARMDYCTYTIRTIHGVLGIKIWIFIDEEY